MFDAIAQFIHNLSSMIGMTNPVGLTMVFGLVVLADIGFIIPFVLEPVLFLITYQAGPFSVPVLLFVLMMALGRQGGTAILYWLSRFAWSRIERLIHRFSPRFANRFSQRVEQFQRRLGNRQAVALATARLTPGLVQVSSVASGIVRVQYFHVMAGAFIAGIIYDAIIVLLGALAHYGLKGLNPEYSVFIVLGIAVIVGLFSFIISRNRRCQAE
jgi:membrane protein DedA with SNARE-associated domain